MGFEPQFKKSFTPNVLQQILPCHILDILVMLTLINLGLLGSQKGYAARFE